jgi:sulfur carrier protein
MEPSKKQQKRMFFRYGTRYEDVLRELGINQETVILLKDGELVPLDEVASSGNLSIKKITSQG